MSSMMALKGCCTEDERTFSLLPPYVQSAFTAEMFSVTDSLMKVLITYQLIR